MSQALNDYFVAEAGEYLDQLHQILAGDAIPDIQRLFRLARGVRGSAEMAQVDRIVTVAVELEGAVRSVVGGQVSWTPEFRDLVQCTVSDLQRLVQSLRSWGPEEEATVRGAIARWRPEQEANGGSAGRAADPGSGDIIPIGSLFFNDAGPHIIGSTGGAPEIVPIESLLFSGGDALRRALSLRPRIERLTARSAAVEGGGGELRDVLAELFDLIQLGVTTPDRGRR